jgi:hypothetical protein
VGASVAAPRRAYQRSIASKDEARSRCPAQMPRAGEHFSDARRRGAPRARNGPQARRPTAFSYVNHLPSSRRRSPAAHRIFVGRAVGLILYNGSERFLSIADKEWSTASMGLCVLLLSHNHWPWPEIDFRIAATDFRTIVCAPVRSVISLCNGNIAISFRVWALEPDGIVLASPFLDARHRNGTQSEPDGRMSCIVADEIVRIISWCVVF